MASKYKINRSNYTIKQRHQLTNKGVVYERDFMTTTNLGGWDSGSIPYGESNFRIFYRSKDNARKKPRPGFWMTPPNGCEGNNNPEKKYYWTEKCVSKTGVTEEDLIDIKTVHHTLLDFAYFGSCEELIKSTIRKILEIYPGEAYAKTPDKARINNIEYYYFENPFEINLFGADDSSVEYKDFLKNFHNYKVIANGEEYEITGTDITYNGMACNYGDSIATLAITSAAGTKTVYKIIDGSKSYGVYTTADFAIVPAESVVEEFFEGLDDFAKVLLDRDSKPIYTAELDWPYESDYGIMTYRRKITWPVSKYGGIDASSSDYEKYVGDLLDLAKFYDEKYTNNLWRMLTHDSIKNMDMTFSNPAKDEDVEDYNIGTTRLEGLLWAFGRQFDELKRRIDGVKHVINVSYDDDNNLPDYFLSGTLENSGWDVSNVNNGANDEEIVIEWAAGDGFTKVYNFEEANNIFLKNLKLNSKEILKKKGTRDGIISLLGLFGLANEDNEYGFTISEKVYTVNADIEHKDIDEQFELARLNGMKLSMQTISADDEGFNEFDGLPFTYVENGDEKYIIPWFDRNLNYDGGTVFQSKGGWAKKDVLKILFDGEPRVFDGESNYTYDESIKNITVIDTIPELSAITQSRVYNGSVCYVDDISGLGDYFYELSTQLTEDDTFFHYFILIDADKFDIIGGENSGWVCAADGLEEGVTEYQDKIILMESVVESYEANNPHNGFWQYDGGETFIDGIRNPFGYHIEQQNKGDNIFGDEAFDCENGLINDFEAYAAKIDISETTDNKKVWFFKGVTNNEISSDSEEAVALYRVYDFENGTITTSPTESAANAIINTKVMKISFNVMSDYVDDFRAYFEASILPYLKQMIPSTTIWSYTINGEGQAPEDKKCMIIFKTTPSNATITIGETPLSGGKYVGKWGEEINYTVSANNYKSKSGRVTLNGNKTINIALEPVQYTLTINADPSDAVVRINGVSRKTAYVNYNDTVSWEVSKTAYVTKRGSVTITGTTTLSVRLEKDTTVVIPCTITFRVKNPSGDTLSGATIEVNGRRLTGTTYSTKVDAEVSYKVSYLHYRTEADTFIADGNRTVDVVLQPVPETKIDIYTIPSTTKVLVSDDFNKNKELTDGEPITKDGEQWLKFEYITDEGQTVSYNASADDRVIIAPDSENAASEEENGD